METLQKLKRPTSKRKLKNAIPFFLPKKKSDLILRKPKRQAITLVDKKIKETKVITEPKPKTINTLSTTIISIKKSATKLKAHKTSEEAVKETQKASILPAKDTNATAAIRNQVEVMNAQEKAPFGKTLFKEKLRKSINDSIKSKKDAEKIKEEGVSKTFTNDLAENLSSEKEKSGGGIEKASLEAPQTPGNELTITEPKELPEVNILGHETLSKENPLTPEKRSPDDTNLDKEADSIDEVMDQNKVSNEQLEKSNEPKFVSTLKDKKQAQTKARNFSKEFRPVEAKIIQGTQKENNNIITHLLGGMHTAHSLTMSKTFKEQNKKKQEEALIRKTVSTKLYSIYSETKKEVNLCFAKIDNYVNYIFDLEITRFSNKFSSRVADLLDENTGFLNEFGSFVSGNELLDEVQIFEIAKKEFIDDMEAPIEHVSSFIEQMLENANTAIKKGEAEKTTFWNSQSTEVRRIAGDIYISVDEKFKDLEQSVKDKEGALIDKITEKFTKALDDLNERYEKAKEENKSWLDRAIDGVKAVIKTIIELKEAIQKMAQKATKYADRIIDDPSGFFGNLADGVGQGFNNFKKNINKHLIVGVLSWLTGSMGGLGIVLPKELNVEGITSLILQILGISIQKIKELVITIIGRKRFEFIEKGVEIGVAAGNKVLNIFKILNEKGLPGLWEFIKDEFSNLKEMLIETVKSFVIEAITKKALEILLSMLIPAAGFIKAVQTLIRFVITLFQKAEQIVKIIDGIIDTFGEILNKNISKVAAMVEGVLGGFISLAISFLAAVLGLDGIATKVQKFIKDKIQPKIDKILKNIAAKIKTVIEKIGLDKLIDKSMVAVEKGKAWVEDKKKKAVETGKASLGKLAEWLGIKKTYKSKDGNKHTLSFDEVNRKPVLMRSSVKISFDSYIANVKNRVLDYNTKNPKEAIDFTGIESQYKLVRNEMSDYSNFNKNDVSAKMDKLANLLSQLPDELADANVFFPNHTIKLSPPFETKYNGNNKSIDGNKIDVKNLSLKLGSLKGSPGKYTSKLFDHIHGKVSKSGQLIKGHLLNHYLGGSGDMAENIMPIAKNTNDAMERSSDNVVKERLAKEKLLTGCVFDYAVGVKYEKSNPLNAVVPSKITMSFIQKQFAGKEKNKANMEDGSKWEPITGALEDRKLDAKNELENLL